MSGKAETFVEQQQKAGVDGFVLEELESDDEHENPESKGKQQSRDEKAGDKARTDDNYSKQPPRTNTSAAGKAEADDKPAGAAADAPASQGTKKPSSSLSPAAQEFVLIASAAKPAAKPIASDSGLVVKELDKDAAEFYPSYLQAEQPAYDHPDDSYVYYDDFFRQHEDGGWEQYDFQTGVWSPISPEDMEDALNMDAIDSALEEVLGGDFEQDEELARLERELEEDENDENYCAFEAELERQGLL